MMSEPTPVELPETAPSVKHIDDQVLLLLRQLAPGVDDHSLTLSFYRISRAWRRAWGISDSFGLND